MLRIISSLTLLLLILSVPVVQAQETKSIDVGIVLDGPSVLTDSILTLIKQEVLLLTKDEFDVRFPENKIIIADWTLAGSRKATTRLLRDDTVDILLTMGVISTSEVVQRGPLSKPTIASVILDAKIQKAPQNENSSGVKNLSYTAIPSEFEDKIKLLQKYTKAKYITVLSNNTIDIAIPNLELRLKKNLADLDFKVELINLGESIPETFNQMNAKTDAVLVAPQTFLSVEDKKQIVDELIERKLPSFAKAGKGDVELGLLLGAGQDDLDIKRLVRRVALNLQRILLGDKPKDLPIFFTTKDKLAINMETARKIGFSPSFELLEESVLINNDFKMAEPLSMFEAVEQSLIANLSLAVKQKEIEVGSLEVRKAWSNVLPQINLSNSFTAIDDDRAEAALGSAPERTSSASAVLNQVLFSEDTFANISIQKNSQASLENELEALALDIVEATTKAYLNVLGAMRTEHIQVNNLELSRSNLELAKIRKKVGQYSISDVYRWESEIANNQKDILTAKANRKNAQLALNRLIHSPLQKDYDFKDIGLDQPEIFLNEDIPSYIENPFTFQLLQDFMVDEGIASAPEIRQIESLIKVRERILKSSKRNFFLPEVSFQASYTDNYDAGGVGQSVSSIKNDEDFSAVIKATYPLFKGGDKFATVKQAQKELEQLNLQKQALEEEIAESIRSSLENVGSSHGSIKWANKAAESANKNLKLVQDSYSQGASDIIVLLDAQNAALNTDQVAANAVYDFLLEYFTFQRAIREFYFRISLQNKDEITQRFKQFFSNNGVDR